jgi:hypothetical protein
MKNQMKLKVILAIFIAAPLCHGMDQQENLIGDHDKERPGRSISVPLDLELVNKHLVRVLKAELQNTTDTEEAVHDTVGIPFKRFLPAANHPRHKPIERINSCPSLPPRK